MKANLRQQRICRGTAPSSTEATGAWQEASGAQGHEYGEQSGLWGHAGGRAQSLGPVSVRRTVDSTLGEKEPCKALSGGLMGSDLILEDALAGRREWVTRRGTGAGRPIQGYQVRAGGDWLAWGASSTPWGSGQGRRGRDLQEEPFLFAERLGVEFERGIAETLCGVSE